MLPGIQIGRMTMAAVFTRMDVPRRSATSASTMNAYRLTTPAGGPQSTQHTRPDRRWTNQRPAIASEHCDHPDRVMVAWPSVLN